MRDIATCYEDSAQCSTKYNVNLVVLGRDMLVICSDKVYFTTSVPLYGQYNELYINSCLPILCTTAYINISYHYRVLKH